MGQTLQPVRTYCPIRLIPWRTDPFRKPDCAKSPDHLSLVGSWRYYSKLA
jgi:hypothetical protein